MRYYGCKTKLLTYIEDAVKSLPFKKRSTFFDVFSGTSAVGKHFKKLGYTVYANDFLEFSYAIAKCYIVLNEEPRFKNLRIGNADKVINYLNSLKGRADFITVDFSPYKGNVRKYLSVENAKKVDAIRKQLFLWKKNSKINENEYYYLLTSLIEAINLVSNVTGTYAAFLKTWDNRALKKMVLKKPEIIKSKRKNRAFKEDANKLVKEVKADILYLDPPYNSRQYASNYFFLELVAEGWFEKKPAIYGRSGMRPYDHQKSKYSKKKEAEKALSDLIKNTKAKYILLSYNNEGIIPLNRLTKILENRGIVKEYVKEHKRYRAINQDGSMTKTNESLFILKITK